MANVKKDDGNIPVPQYLNTSTGLYEDLEGSNGAAKMQPLGSTAALFHERLAKSVAGLLDVQSIAFGSTKRVTRVVNDDTIEARVGFGADPVTIENATGAEVDVYISYTNPPWSAGANAAAYNGDYAARNVTSEYFIVEPGATDVVAIGFSYILAPGAGIANLELSDDGGATWQNPSDIAGVRRSDGVTGVSMDTLDQYAASITADAIAFVLPTAGQWQLRATISGTQNASATNTNLFLDRVFFETDGNALSVKAGESVEVSVQASSVYYYAPDGTAQLRVFAE